MVGHENYFTIFGIDPGSRNVGVSVFFINPSDLSIARVIPIQICLDKYNNNNCQNSFLHIRLLLLGREIRRLLKAFNPVAIGIESCFINPGRLGAVIPLASAISVISSAIIYNDSNTKLIEYAPSIIKKTIGASPHANKDPILEALERIEEINEIINLDLLTEHTIDGIAIGCTLLKEIREKGITCLF